MYFVWGVCVWVCGVGVCVGGVWVWVWGVGCGGGGVYVCVFPLDTAVMA